jgi:hypothetical protein
MLPSVCYYLVTYSIMQEIPFSCQARKHSVIAVAPSGATLNAAVTFYDVNSLRATAVQLAVSAWTTKFFHHLK